jgi:hypothetical protein
MNNLPKLVKPYYTIDEVFDRLKRIGAEISNVDDVFLLAREGRLEVKLLLGEHDLILIKKDDAIPHLRAGCHGQLTHIEDDVVESYISRFGGRVDEVKVFLNEFLYGNYMVFSGYLTGENHVVNMGLEEREGVDYSAEEEFKIVNANQFILASRSYPVMATPLKMIGSYTRWNNNFFEPVDLCEKDMRDDSFDAISRFAVEINDAIYFTCAFAQECPFLNSMSVFIELSNGKKHTPLYSLDRTIVQKLLRDEKNRVVTVASLKSFEQKYLEINHDGNLRSTNTTFPFIVDEAVNSANRLRSFTSCDLFTNPPMPSSELFSEISAVVDEYVSENDRGPSFEQLWQYLKLWPSFEYDTKKRAVCGISNRPLTRENFKKNFDRWTKKPDNCG